MASPEFDPRFRCDHCARFIEEYETVFMGCDAAYCSHTCRKSASGRSSSGFTGGATNGAGLMSRTPSCSVVSSSSTPRAARVPSCSQLSSVSSSNLSSNLTSTTGMGSAEGTRPGGGLIGRVFGGVMAVLASRLKGASLLRPDSLDKFGGSGIWLAPEEEISIGRALLPWTTSSSRLQDVMEDFM